MNKIGSHKVPNHCCHQSSLSQTVSIMLLSDIIQSHSFLSDPSLPQDFPYPFSLLRNDLPALKRCKLSCYEGHYLPMQPCPTTTQWILMCVTISLVSIYFVDHPKTPFNSLCNEIILDYLEVGGGITKAVKIRAGNKRGSQRDFTKGGNEIGNMKKIWLAIVGFRDRRYHKLRNTGASRNWEWLLIECQQRNGDLSPSAARLGIMPTTWTCL